MPYLAHFSLSNLQETVLRFLKGKSMKFKSSVKQLRVNNNFILTANNL